MNRKFVSIVSALLLAAAPAIAAETMMEEGEYAGVRFDISSGYYYQSSDLKRLPKGAAVSVGNTAARTTNVKGEVSEHGWFIAPRAGYYVPHSDTVTFGVEFEPEFMVSVSTDVKVTGNGESELRGAILGEVAGANVSTAEIDSVFVDSVLGNSAIESAAVNAHNILADRVGVDTMLTTANSAAEIRAGLNTLIRSSDDTGMAANTSVTVTWDRFSREFLGQLPVNEKLQVAGRVDSATERRPQADRTALINNLFAGADPPGAPPQGTVSITNLDKSPTLFHVNLPVYAVAKFKSPQSSVRGHVGLGTGVMFYDMGDKVDGGASWPILAKAGFEIPVRPNIRVGGDARFHYALTTPSNVDSIWGIRVGARMTYFF